VLRRIVGVVLVSGLLLAGLNGSWCVVAAADEGNAAVVEKVGASLVFIRTQFIGQVRMSTEAGTQWSDSYVVAGQCTGYVVDPRGYIVTAGHCVNGADKEIHNALRMKLLAEAAQVLGKGSEWVRNWYQVAVAQEWLIRGDEKTAGPVVEVSVRQPAGTGQVLRSWADAHVVDFQEFTAGDNAILKVAPVRELSPLVISGRTPTPGDDVVSVGFPGAVRANAGGAAVPQPSYKTGTVSSRQVDVSGITRTEVSATMGSGMSGGPTVNARGEVIGTNSSGNSLPEENDSFNFITDNLALRTYLSANNVVLAQPEPEDRRSVWAWQVVLAGVLAAVIVVMLVVIWLRRRRRSVPPPAFHLPPSGPPPHSPYDAAQFARPPMPTPPVRPQQVSVPGPPVHTAPVVRSAPHGHVSQQVPPYHPAPSPPVPREQIGHQPVPLWRGPTMMAGPAGGVAVGMRAASHSPAPLHVRPTVPVAVPVAAQPPTPQNPTPQNPTPQTGAVVRTGTPQAAAVPGGRPPEVSLRQATADNDPGPTIVGPTIVGPTAVIALPANPAAAEPDR
jgi:serine protease Do